MSCKEPLQTWRAWSLMMESLHAADGLFEARQLPRVVRRNLKLAACLLLCRFHVASTFAGPFSFYSGSDKLRAMAVASLCEENLNLPSAARRLKEAAFASSSRFAQPFASSKCSGAGGHEARGPATNCSDILSECQCMSSPCSQFVRNTTMATSRTSPRRASAAIANIHQLGLYQRTFQDGAGLSAEVPVQRIHREGARQVSSAVLLKHVLSSLDLVLCRSMTLAQLRKVLKHLGCNA